MKQIGDKKVFSVSEVNSVAKETLELLTFWVEGEVSTVQTNPHWYYAYITLKDGENVLSCFVEPRLLLDLPKDIVGQKVLTYGMLTLFKKSEYKMRVFRIEHAGAGVHQGEFDKLYQKLQKEGLFEKKYKKELPIYPKRVCIVTSVNSAGWNDFKTHTIDKFPNISLYSANIQVEGPKAIDNLLKVLPKIDALNFDVVVITRGGGAQESLMQVFNDEQVTRAIFNLKTPAVVAIGHEINTSLAELAADVRASTPTDAASIVTKGYLAASDKLEHLRQLLKSKTDYHFSSNFQKLDNFYFTFQRSKTIFKDLPIRLEKTGEALKRYEKHIIDASFERLSEMHSDLNRGAKLIVAVNLQKLQSLEKQLKILSPESTIKRGYAVTYDLGGKIIRSIDNVVVGSDIKVKLFDGHMLSKVKSKEKNA